MKIAIGSDHAGFFYKEKLKSFLTEIGHIVKDLGTFTSESVDYPDFAHSVALSISSKENDFGILICGSGIGVCITANKHQNVRAALCWQKEIAVLSRQHNDANIICLPARFIAYEFAQDLIDTFLKTEFEGGRHLKRVNKINC